MRHVEDLSLCVRACVKSGRRNFALAQQAENFNVVVVVVIHNRLWKEAIDHHDALFFVLYNV